jgi:hypothetical protein
MRLVSPVLQIVLATAIAGQQASPPPASAEDRVTGTVRMVSTGPNAQNTTIEIESGSGHIKYEIICTSSTLITYKGQASTLAEVKQKRMITCFGVLNNQQLAAHRCEVK